MCGLPPISPHHVPSLGFPLSPQVIVDCISRFRITYSPSIVVVEATFYSSLDCNSVRSRRVCGTEKSSPPKPMDWPSASSYGTFEPSMDVEMDEGGRAFCTSGAFNIVCTYVHTYIHTV